MLHRNSKLLIAILALSTTLLSACGKDNKNGAYQDGSDACSQRFVDDTNALAHYTVNSSDASSIDAAEAAINDYSSKYSGVRCKAMNQKTWEESYVDVDGTTNNARSTIASARARRAEQDRQERENCSSAFIADLRSLAETSVTNEPGSLDSFEKKMLGFAAKYKGLKCKARNAGTGQEVWLNVDELMEKSKNDINEYRRKNAQSGDVDVVTKPVADPANPKPGTLPTDQNPTKPAPIGTIDLNAPVAKGFTFEVKDAEKLNGYAAAGSEMILQKGNATSLSSLTNRADNLCFVERAPGAKALVKGEKLRFTRIQDRGQKLMIAGDKLTIGCLRMKGAGDWTGTELQEVFGDLAKIVPAGAK